MTFYTVGHKENYRKAIAEHGRILKASGGYAFSSLKLTCQFLEEEGHVEDWGIWELIDCKDADIQLPTLQTDYWGYLKREIAIGNEIGYLSSKNLP